MAKRNQRAISSIRGLKVVSMSISILIADDHQIVRSGLRNLFDSQEDMQVVAEAEDGRMAVKLAHDLLPCVVVMDTTMPQLQRRRGHAADHGGHAQCPDRRAVGQCRQAVRRRST